MRATKRAVLILVALVALAASACVRTPTPPHPPIAKSQASLDALARNLASRAHARDVEYFDPFVRDKGTIPGLMEQIERSGIATNYASHLRTESATSAALVYGNTLGGSTDFDVWLVLVDGRWIVKRVSGIW